MDGETTERERELAHEHDSSSRAILCSIQSCPSCHGRGRSTSWLLLASGHIPADFITKLSRATEFPRSKLFMCYRCLSVSLSEKHRGGSNAAQHQCEEKLTIRFTKRIKEKGLSWQLWGRSLSSRLRRKLTLTTWISGKGDLAHDAAMFCSAFSEPCPQPESVLVPFHGMSGLFLAKAAVGWVKCKASAASTFCYILWPQRSHVSET